MDNEASTTLEYIEDKAVVFDVCFLSNVKAARTLHIVDANGVHIYIDVSEDSLPVALTLVHKPSLPIQYQEVPEGTLLPFKHLFAFAAQMITLDREGLTFLRESKSAALIPAHTQHQQEVITNVTRRPLKWSKAACVA